LGGRDAKLDELERKVQERTRELAERNLALERAAEQHHKTEEALRQSEERFRTAFVTSPDSINITRLVDGVYIAINAGFTRLTGWTEDDVIGRSSVALGIWEVPADRDRLVAELRERGRVENLEARFRFKDGRSVTGLMSASILQLENDPYILSITRDVTELKRAEAERDRLAEQLRHAQKMEAIGRLAGGVAHDFNNLLTVILSCSATLREDVAAGRDPDPEDVEAIHSAGERARELTRQLLAFARKQVIQPRALDLGVAVRSAEKLLRRVLGEDVDLEVNAGSALWPVYCDPGQLEQVLMNLAVNARDAMPAGGRISLSIRNVAAPGNGAAARGRPGEWVLLAMHDSGVGMDATVKAHLFEPFFTTKPAGAGTGLGLATVYGIVDQAAGFLHVDSAPGQGTTIEVWLPRSDRTADLQAETAHTATRDGSETVLAVEDDPLVRALTVRVLRAAGYQVLVASRASEALALVRSGATFDLLVTDVVMPGLDGRGLAEALHHLRPGAPVLYVSGYTGDAIAQRGVLDPGIELLPKPFTPGDLLARVRALLDSAAERLA
jgi:PAS domain S-box-containing protein